MWADAICFNLVLQDTVTFTSGYKEIYMLSLHPTDPREIENNDYAKFWGVNKMYYEIGAIEGARLI